MVLVAKLHTDSLATYLSSLPLSAYGAIVGLTGAGLLWFSYKTSDTRKLMEQTQTTEIADLPGLLKKHQIETGETSMLVEIKGKVACRNPTHARSAPGKHAAFVRTLVLRDYLFRQYYGPSQFEWEKRKSAVTTHNESTEFFIVAKKATDCVRVDLDSLTAEDSKVTLQVVHEEEVKDKEKEEDAAALFDPPSPDMRVLRFRRRDEILPVGHQVYALGHARLASDGTPVLFNREKETFILSVRNEDELSNKLAVSASRTRLIGGILAAIGTLVIAADAYLSSSK